MADLKRLCAEAGFTQIETYIASGNVVFDSKLAEAKVKVALETRLHELTGKAVGVLVRSAAEMAAILKANPFAKADPKFTYVLFLDDVPPKDELKRATGKSDEELRLGAREIYVHYPSGMGKSKLKIAASKTGTARNLNTVAKLTEIVSG